MEKGTQNLRWQSLWQFPHHAPRQGETHVVLIALEYFFARCKTRYQNSGGTALTNPTRVRLA
jgi:hypothetical protein